MTEWEAIPNGRPRLTWEWTDADGTVHEVVACWGWRRPPRKIGHPIWRNLKVWKPY